MEYTGMSFARLSAYVMEYSSTATILSASPRSIRVWVAAGLSEIIFSALSGSSMGLPALSVTGFASVSEAAVSEVSVSEAAVPAVVSETAAVVSDTVTSVPAVFPDAVHEANMRQAAATEAESANDF